MIEEGQEYTTPIYDEDGNLIETIEDYDVYLDEDIPEEEHDDAYYLGEESDLAEEDYAEEDNVDPVESRILTASERYTIARDSVMERLTQILENGEITVEDNADLNEAMFEYTESVTDMKDKLNEVEHGNNDTNGINQGTVTTVMPAELQHLIDLMNNGGRNDLLFVDEEGRVLVEGEQVPKLKLVELEVEKLFADYAEIEELVAKKATIEELEAVKAQIGNLKADEIIADIIHGNTADIGDLTSQIGRIETLTGGNLTMKNIQSLILTAQKVTVEDAFIKDAMIDTVTASKINTGSLNTNLVNIQSDDGSLTLNGTLQQFKDKNNKVRIQMGKDAQGNFTFGLFDETGTGTLIDSKGITEKAIGDGIIVDKMIGDDANISGGKLDISSVVTEINDGTTTIKGTKIKLDEQNQTLDIAFNGMSSAVTEQGKTIGNHTTSISTMQGNIKTLISDSTIIEDGETVKLKDAYSSMKQDVGGFGVSLKKVESDFTNMEIGGRNLLLDSGKEYTNNIYNICSYKPSELLVEGETYTVSVCVTPADKVTNFPLYFSSGSSKVADLFVNGIGKQIISSTFTMKYAPDKVPPNADSGYARANLYRFPNDGTVTTNSTIHWIKISKGNKSTTDWTPAPEDGTNALSGLSTRVGEAESKLTLEGLKTVIGSTYTTSEDFNNMTIGGTNLLLNSSLMYAIFPSNSNFTFETVNNVQSSGVTMDGYNYKCTADNGATNSSRGIKVNSKDMGVKVGDTVSFGIDIKGTFGTSNNGLAIMHKTTTNSNFYAAISKGEPHATSIPDWTRKTRTYTIPSDIGLETDGSFNLWFFFGGGTGAPTDAWVRKIKLVKGNKITDWSEAPADLQSWVANRGYATTSDVTQAVSDFTLKFKESGGYNLLYNGNFKNGFNNWINLGDNTIITNSSFPANQVNARLGGELGVSKSIQQNLPDINYSGPITLSFWSNVTSAGNKGTTNPYIGAQITVEFTDGTKVYPGLSYDNVYDTWQRRTFTYETPSGKRIKAMYLGIYNRDTTKVAYITDVILTKGSLEVPFAPNPNEVFDGITVIDKTGIKVTQSNYNGYTHMKADGFYLNNGIEDVIKCTSTGLIVKGNVTITGGSVPDDVLTKTIRDGATNGTNAQTTLNTKTTDWDNALNRVKEWAYGAVTGSTNINGGLIETNTILTRHLAIGDFNNYCPVTPDNCSKFGYRKIADTTNGDWMQVDTPIRDNLMCKDLYAEYSGNVAGTYRVSFTMSSTVQGTTTSGGTEIGYLNVAIGFYCKTITGANAWYIPVGPKSNSTDSVQTFSATITIPSNIKSFGIGLQHAGWGSFSGVTKIKDVVVNKMMTGSLIVDGAIDGKTIRGGEIIGGLIKSDAVNAENNPMFSLNGDGEIIGAKIDCVYLNAEEDISGNVLNINYIGNSRYPQVLDEDITVYIDTSKASDEDYFDGATYASMDDLFAAVPRNLNGYTIRINFQTDYTGNLKMTQFHSGHCYIHLNKHTIRGYIWVYGASMRYAIYGNTSSANGGTTNFGILMPSSGIDTSGYSYTIRAEYTTCTIYDLQIYAASNTSTQNSGIVCTNMCKAYISNISAYNNPIHLVRSHSASHVYVAGSDGMTSSNTFSAVSGSIQCLNPTNQAGSSIGKPTYTSGNAQIFSTGTTFATTGNSGSNNSGATTETTTVTLKATSGDTYRRDVYYSWKKDGTVRQGDYGYGNCDGFWFFGSQIGNYTGKNITKVSITIKRNTGAGSSSAVPHTLVGHNYTSRPSGTPEPMGSAIRTFSLSTGSSVTLNLTSAEIVTFKKYKGIGLKAAYDSKYYSSCSATCTVKITYTE